MSDEQALEKAIYYLERYADDDELAGLNGSGCYNHPHEVISNWVEHINKLRKEV